MQKKNIFNDHISQYQSSAAIDSKKQDQIVRFKHKQTRKIYHTSLYNIIHLQDNQIKDIKKEILQFINKQIHNCLPIRQVAIIRQEATQIYIFKSSYKNYKPLRLYLNEKFELMPLYYKIAENIAIFHQKGIIFNNFSLSGILIKGQDILFDIPYFSSIKKVQKQQRIIKNKSEDIKNIYVSPEVNFRNQIASQLSDIWSLGILFLQLALCEDLQNYVDFIYSPKFLWQKVNNISEINARTLIKKMLKDNPNERIKLNEIINLQFQTKEPEQQMPCLISFQLFPISKYDQKKSKSLIIPQKQQKLQLQIQYMELKDNEMINVIWKSHNQSRFYSYISSQLFQNKLKYYFKHMKQFYHQLCNYKNNCILTQDGYFQYRIQHERLLQKRNGIILQQKQVLTDRAMFPHNCIIMLKNDKGAKFTGILIDHNLILTTASAIYDRDNRRRSQYIQYEDRIAEEQQNIMLLLNIYNSLNRCYSYGYPPQYQTSLQFQKYKYDYAVILIEKVQYKNIIYLKRYINIIYDVDQNKIKKKIQEKGGDQLQFHYSIDGANYLRNQIHIQHANFICNELVFPKCPAGTPIFINFSNGSSACVGMTTSSQPLLFNELISSTLFKMIMDLDQTHFISTLTYNINIHHSDTFDFFNQFPNTFYLTRQDQMLMIVNNQKKDSYRNMLQQQGNLKQLASFYEKLVGRKDKKIIISELNTALQIYETIYGAYHYKISSICYLKYIMQEDQLNKYQKLSLLQRIIQIQQRYNYNPFYRINAYFKLSLQKNLFDYQKCIQFFKKYNAYIILGKFYHNIATIIEQKQHNLQKAIGYLQQTIKLKQKRQTILFHLQSCTLLASKYIHFQNYNRICQILLEVNYHIPKILDAQQKMRLQLSMKMTWAQVQQGARFMSNKPDSLISLMNRVRGQMNLNNSGLNLSNFMS